MSLQENKQKPTYLFFFVGVKGKASAYSLLNFNKLSHNLNFTFRNEGI